MPTSEKTTRSSARKGQRGMTRRATRTLIWGLVIVALGLAAILLRPVRCDGCAGWTIRPRAVRLAPGWRVYCPRAPLPGARPVLCPGCYGRLLDQSPARDDEAREALRRYLTNPDALSRLREAVERAEPPGRAGG